MDKTFKWKFRLKICWGGEIMAHQVNSIDYGDYRYSVGDIVKISSSKEYMYAGIGNSYPNNMPGISQDTRKITSIWKQDAVGMVVLNPIGTSYVSGPQGYGGGYIRPEQIVPGSGGTKIKHYVSYNANGGSNAPSKQSKVHGSVLKLSESKPTREGYTFVKWNTNKSGTGTSYNPGAEFNVDEDTTLYAIWKINTWTVKFDANGGSGAPGNQTKTYGEILVLSSSKPTRPNYNFVGWGKSAESTTVAYAPGDTYKSNANITLYAIWKLAYVKPRISNLRVDRCSEIGLLSDEGEYARVQFEWNCDKTVKAINIQWDYGSFSVSASGTKGTVKQTVGGEFSTENAYTITVHVEDALDYSEASAQLPQMKYLIDFRPKGIAVGKPAEFDDVFDIGYPTAYMNGKFYFRGYGNGFRYKVTGGRFELVTMSNGSSLNLVYIEDGSSGWTNNFIKIDHVNKKINFDFPEGVNFNKIIVRENIKANLNIEMNNGNRINWSNGSEIYGNGSQHFYLFASQEANYAAHLGVHDSMWTFDPDSNGALQLGAPNHKWGALYAQNGAIQTSDRNLKKDIHEIDDKYVDLFMKLLPVSFKFNDGVRTHIGFISQDVEEAMADVGLTDLDFAGFCKDKKTHQIQKTQQINTIDESGEEVIETILYLEDEAIPDEYIYSLRYDEFVALNTMMIQKLIGRVKHLEEVIENGNQSIK